MNIPQWLDNLYPEMQKTVKNSSQEQWKRAMIPRGMPLSLLMDLRRTWRDLLDSDGYSIIQAAATLWWWAHGGNFDIWPTPTMVEKQYKELKK